MPVEQLPRRVPHSSDDAKLVEYDAYIDRQIQSTRRAVKAVDIATALVTLLAGAIAFLLTIALLEHWILPHGFSTFGRSVLFLALLAGTGTFAYRRLWPLLVHSINPVYAAQTIEHSSPTLKNSLINLLLFRTRRAEISDAVFRTLEEQAAQRLTRIPVDAAVDRSQLIRLGYILLAIVAVAAIYKLVSPKDPLVSAERVLMPWADIVPASRVQIAAIEPGNVTIARGEFLDVSAEIRGIDEDDPVLLRYTTTDGQAIDKPIPMKAATGGMKFSCRLPDAVNPTGAPGLSRSVRYRIEAGDARSLDYQVIVVPAPSILVERVEYDYPEYTGYQDRTVEHVGDIRAIEGTRVTIHARANGPIDEATLDFDADGRRDLTMKFTGTQAQTEFLLALRDDRQTPQHASYVLRFTNQEGRSNRVPVKHSIDVEADYTPEIAILAPQEKTRDLRLDETVTIEVEARDPDFALRQVLLKGKAPGRSEMSEALLAKEHSGRFTARFDFTPITHDFRAGDVVEVWSIASDVRAPEPNTAATDPKYFRIVSPDPNQVPPDRIAQRDPPRKPNEPAGDAEQHGQDGKQDQDGGQGHNGQPNPRNGGQAGEQNRSGQTPNESQPESGEQGTQQGDSSGDADPSNSRRDAQPNEVDSQSDANSEPQSGESSPQEGQSANPSGESNQGQPKPGEQNQSSNEQQGSQDQGGEPRPGTENSTNSNPSAGSAQSSAQNQSGADGAKNSNPSNSQNANGKQTGAGAAGGDRSSNDSQPAGARPDHAAEGQQTSDGSQRDLDGKQGAPQGDSPDSTPISSQGDNDAEAFERISKHLKENGELGDQAQSGNEQKESPDSNAPQPAGEQEANRRDAQGNNAERGSPAHNAQPGSEQQAPQRSDDEPQSSQTNQPGKPSQPNQPNQPGEKQSGDDAGANQPEGSQPTGDSQQGKPEAAGAEQPTANEKQQQPDSAAGPGTETRPGDLPDDAQPPKETGQEQSSPGGQQTGSKAESGAGDQPQDNQGVPNSDPQTKPSEKPRQKPSGDETKPDEAEPPSGARGKRESDSHGEQGGDKPGGGEEGGGQKAPREGTGSAGQNQSADEGAGESSERGQGQDSPDAGSDAVANRRTGQSGTDTPGEGSTERETSQRHDPSEPESRADNESPQPDRQQAPQGDSTSTGEKPNRNDGSKPADGQQSPQEGNPSAPGGNQPGSPDGNQEPRPAGPPPKTGEGTAPDADAANLDYARKQTDLVLEKLSEQLKRKQVDQSLLDKLGWTQDELNDFIARWQQRKAAAQANEPNADAARRELDDALRSLGLRRGPLQQRKIRDDTQRDLRQGYRGAVPLEYQERLRAYNQGVSRSRQAAE